jgi:hypothetical protein
VSRPNVWHACIATFVRKRKKGQFSHIEQLHHLYRAIPRWSELGSHTFRVVHSMLVKTERLVSVEFGEVHKGPFTGTPSCSQ